MSDVIEEPSDVVEEQPEESETEESEEQEQANVTDIATRQAAKQAAIDELLSRIAPVAERPPFTKGMYYGESGVGKTVAAATAPKPLILDVEHGTVSLANHPELADVAVITVKNLRDVTGILSLARAGHPRFKEFDTFIIDSVTELQQRHLDEHLDKMFAKDRTGKRSKYAAFQGDYKENTGFMRRLIVEMRDLDKNLILTALEMEDQNEETGEVKVRPAITPKLSQTIQATMDFMGRMTLGRDDDKNVVRKLQLQPSRTVRAKCRIGGLPPVLVDPSFDKIVKANQTPVKKGK